MKELSKKHIQLLPEHIIDQIKAGEVIERPATLIKELLENSIDAESTNISIHIIDNGMELISIVDNGKGIDSNDLPLAFCRHATSKINNFEDIYNLYTYGFRGEALASMASISKITCTSTQDGKKGIIKINGGEIITHQQDESHDDRELNGTSIFVKDLFYNTPARLKFIKSKTSEKNQLKRVLNAFLLTHPQITFSIKWDDQDRQVYPAIEENELEKRIQKMFFKKVHTSFQHIQSEYDQVGFSCLLSNESSRGNAGKHQYLFINKRFVQDVQIHKVILNSAANLWPISETGHYFAFIDLPADQLDVNVHPNKTVVKLYRSAQVFSQISNSIKRVISKQQEFISADKSNSLIFEDAEHTVDDNQFKSLNFSQHKNQNDLFSKNSFSSNDLFNKELNYKSTTHNTLNDFIDASLDYSLIFANTDFAIITTYEEKSPLLINIKKLAWLAFTKVLSEESTTIPLLVSEPLRDLNPATMSFIDQLNRYGFELDQLDKTTVVLRAYPQLLDGLPYLDYLKELIKSFDTAPSKNETIDKIIERLIQNNKSPAPALGAHAIRKLIDQFNLTWLKEQKIVISLNNSKLESLFL